MQDIYKIITNNILNQNSRNLINATLITVYYIIKMKRYFNAEIHADIVKFLFMFSLFLHKKIHQHKTKYIPKEPDEMDMEFVLL